MANFMLCIFYQNKTFKKNPKKINKNKTKNISGNLKYIFPNDQWSKRNHHGNQKIIHNIVN